MGGLLLQFEEELGGDVEELGFEALAEEAAVGAASLEVPRVLPKAGLPPLSTGEGFLEVRDDDSLRKVRGDDVRA